ncbi:HemK/PrmC family methyltransferase, partial [Jatrophihabitans endophyticus]|uniref:N5-glutamine methyltransferase family protein n=1 Tax=Jatrophihabitans endophyticus TaxID=1206085 RepID=UPI0019E82A05
MNTRALLADAARRLAAAGVDSPRVDAELLLAARLDIPRSALVTRDEVPDSVARAYDGDLDRRVRREPLQHITGVAPFRHLELRVGPGVFVPRPETELLVDAVLPHLRMLHEPRVVDLCAGSGALALAVADELSGARVVAVERSGSALRWLGENIAAVDVGDSEVRVLGGDLRDPELLMPLRGRADAVVSNPPYVP